MVSTEQYTTNRSEKTRSYERKNNKPDHSGLGNQEAEVLFLVGVIKNQDLFFELVSYLSEDDFSNDLNRDIFTCVKSLYINGTDKLTPAKLASEAKRLNLLNATSIHNAISNIINQPVSKTECLSHFGIIKRDSIRRSYLDDLVDLYPAVKNSTLSAQQLIGLVESRLLGKINKLSSDETGLREFAPESWKIIQNLANNPGQIGLDIGFPLWQQHIGQFRPGSVHFLAASTGVGKSIFGLRAAIQVAKLYRIPVLVLDSEMSLRDNSPRALGIYFKIPFWILETGIWRLSDEEIATKNLSPMDFEDVKDAQRKLNNEDLLKQYCELPITYKSINGLNVEGALPFMRQWFHQKVKIVDHNAKVPNGFIVYDYIKLNTTDELKRGGVDLKEYQSLGLNCSMLHDFNAQYCLSTLTFGQTNREIDDNINCIAGAKRLAELCESVSLLREKPQAEKMMDTQGNIMIRVFKGRHGTKTGSSHINFKFHGNIGYFEELGLGQLVRLEKKSKKKKKNDDENEENTES